MIKKGSRLRQLLIIAAVLISTLSGGFAADLTWNTHVFPDGFTLITKEIHDYPVCSLHLFVAAGSVNENPKINGISHFYEHLFFKGTKRRSASDMKSEMESYGGDINGSTYRDYTEFMVNLPGVYADKGVDYLMDAFLNAALIPAEVEKERKVVLDEVSLDDANPERKITDVFQSNMYSVSPYRMPVAGSPETVSHISLDDIKNWKKKYYVPANATLVIIGDIDSQKIQDQVADVLKGTRNSPFTAPVFPKEPPRTTPVVLEMKQPVDQSIFMLGYLVTGLDTPEDIYPLDVLTFMLGYGRSSVLNRELRDNSQIALEVSADFLTQHYPSTFEITATCKPQNVAACKEKVLKIIEDIRNGKIEPQEIERAKTLLNGVYTLGNTTDNGKASTIGFYAAMHSGDFAKDYLAHIAQVQPADLVRIAKKYFQDNYTEIVFNPQ